MLQPPRIRGIIKKKRGKKNKTEDIYSHFSWGSQLPAPKSRGNKYVLEISFGSLLILLLQIKHDSSEAPETVLPNRSSAALKPVFSLNNPLSCSCSNISRSRHDLSSNLFCHSNFITWNYIPKTSYRLWNAITVLNWHTLVSERRVFWIPVLQSCTNRSDKCNTPDHPLMFF